MGDVDRLIVWPGAWPGAALRTRTAPAEDEDERARVGQKGRQTSRIRKGLKGRTQDEVRPTTVWRGGSPLGEARGARRACVSLVLSVCVRMLVRVDSWSRTS